VKAAGAGPRRVVLAGVAGGGKTTLLRELAARGFATRGDSARETIAARLSRGLPPRPEPQAFAAAVLEADIAKHRSADGESGPVFFERGVVDALGMAAAAGALSPAQVQAHLARYPYDRRCFVLPPWPAIYVQDAERDHPFDEAAQWHPRIVAWYLRCGYEVVQVPPAPAAERADFVLRAG
jgi:predicted ATPase